MLKPHPLDILYIEDNLDDRLILEEYLMDSANIRSLKSCSSLEEAYALLKENSFDIIFLDLSLPDSNGFDGVVRLNGRIKSSIPIIVLTGLSDHSTAAKALKLGAQDFLVKGDYNTIVLNKAIRYSIERHKVQLELISKNREILISRNRLAKAEEMSDLGSWEIDLKTNTIKLSDGMIQLLKLNEKDRNISFSKFGSFIHKDDKFRSLKYFLKTHNNLTPSSWETRLVTSEGQTLHTYCKTEMIGSSNNDYLVMYGITLDISNLKEAEQVKEEFTNQLSEKVKERTLELEETKLQLEKSLRKEKELGELKSRFVSTASHQFRTPLTVIQSNIGLLEMQVNKIETKAKPMLEKITTRVKREIVRMTGIMDEVLILGKINSGGITPIFRSSDLVEVCNNVVAKHNEIQDDGRMSMIAVKGSPRPIMLDTNLFDQAFSNMISNAFKYSLGKPAPEVTIVFGEQEVEIIVQDYGMGIPPEDLNNLFTPFFRASNVLDISGTGLGTTIMKEYITLNDGELSVESTVNKGSTFKIHFKK